MNRQLFTPSPLNINAVEKILHKNKDSEELYEKPKKCNCSNCFCLECQCQGSTCNCLKCDGILGTPSECQRIKDEQFTSISANSSSSHSTSVSSVPELPVDLQPLCLIRQERYYVDRQIQD